MALGIQPGALLLLPPSLPPSLLSSTCLSLSLSLSCFLRLYFNFLPISTYIHQHLMLCPFPCTPSTPNAMHMPMHSLKNSCDAHALGLPLNLPIPPSLQLCLPFAFLFPVFIYIYLTNPFLFMYPSRLGATPVPMHMTSPSPSLISSVLRSIPLAFWRFIHIFLIHVHPCIYQGPVLCPCPCQL